MVAEFFAYQNGYVQGIAAMLSKTGGAGGRPARSRIHRR